MDSKELKSIIEALLFTWGDPLEIKDIASILELDKEEVGTIMSEMIDEFDYNMRGLKIIKVNDSYQLGTRPEHFSWIKKLSSPKVVKNLSNAALETLSIIAYRQPIIKSDIEAIRGVRCDKAIETLTDRELIEEIGRLERVGRPILYGTTDVFLRTFGLEGLENLPPLNELIDDFDSREGEK
ncbi:SMC-Scp complex subunit ScpB [Tissierella pigra]|uniref:SMC-Scp complex subunit ScpB n=1 Tax=Tissierella pigra TaxID=2607614 RepID=UPI001C121344|nr:SMC-Scp complex subunit ScpB [Tissierella pigra]MBU5426638.1 SMC-Scp complex subunit ScpB [Tissierella pigra]